MCYFCKISASLLSVQALSVIFHFVKQAAPWFLLTGADRVVVKSMASWVKADPNLSPDPFLYKM